METLVIFQITHRYAFVPRRIAAHPAPMASMLITRDRSGGEFIDQRVQCGHP